MTFLRVLVVVILVLWLISLIRLGGSVQYSEDGLVVRLIAGPARITLFPGKKKETEPKKPPKEKKKKPPKEDQKAEKKGGALPPVMELLPLVGEAAGQIKRKIRIDDLTVHLTWAADDPFQTAMGFGAGNAAMGIIWPILDNNFKVKRHDLAVAVDFDGKSPVIYCLVSLTMTVGQLVSFVVHFGVKFLMMWSRSQRGSVKKQEVSHESE
jgi:hypothetical protein